MKINYFYAPQSRIPEVTRIDFEKVAVPDTGKGYHQCYAHKWANLNRFLVRSYFDLSFRVLPFEKDASEYKIILNDKYTMSLFKNEIVRIKPSDSVSIDRPVLQVLISTVFYSKKTCFMEVANPESLNSNLKLIKGKFDISSWTRPVNIALEVQHLGKDIIIKRNEIIAEIVFHTEKINENIILQRNENPSEKLIKLSYDNATVSGYLPNAKRLINKGRKLLRSII